MQFFMEPVAIYDLRCSTDLKSKKTIRIHKLTQRDGMKKKTSKYNKLVNAVLRSEPEELKKLCKILGKTTLSVNEQILFDFLSDLLNDDRTDAILSKADLKLIDKLTKK